MTRTIHVLFAIGLLPLAGSPAAADPPVGRIACLLEDNGAELLPLLTNPGGDLGEGQVEKEVVFSGTSGIKITVYQRYFNLLPGWAYRIAERPKEGEYRYLRLAWKSAGTTGLMLQLHDDKDWHLRYTAGANKFGWETKFVAETPPHEWTVVTVDLFKDFGEREIHGIALTAFDGIGYFDHIYLAPTIADLDRIDATGLAAGAPIKLSAEELEQHFANLTSADASVGYRSFWTLVAAGEPSRAFLAKKLGGDIAVVDAAKIDEWIKQLDDEEYSIREKATAALARHYTAARAAIDAALKDTKSVEARTRLATIIQQAQLPVDASERANQQARRILQELAERTKR